MSEWIKVEDHLPVSGEVVLAVLAKKNTVGKVDVLEFVDSDDSAVKWRAPYCIYWELEAVTHWMRLPEAP